MRGGSRTIGIIGATGHFGRVISEALYERFPQYRFYLLGRGGAQASSPNLSLYRYDFRVDRELPNFGSDPDIILDLSGPVLEDDGSAMEACARRGVPYMDMAIHNSHLKIAERIAAEYPAATILAHFGFFPGLSNLIISRGFEINGAAKGILVNEFPIFAGGGRNVARSLSDLLNDSITQRNLINGKIHSFRMHSERESFQLNGRRNFYYRWEYAEIPSLLRSNPGMESLERFVTIIPGSFNPIFKAMVRSWNSFLNPMLRRILPRIVYILKFYFLKNVDPSMEMHFFRDRDWEPVITLRVREAVRFHGQIMAAFLEALFQKRIGAGLYTPEQLFELGEILPPGEYENYELIIKG